MVSLLLRRIVQQRVQRSCGASCTPAAAPGARGCLMLLLPALGLAAPPPAPPHAWDVARGSAPSRPSGSGWGTWCWVWGVGFGTWLVALRHPVHLHASLHGVQGGGRGLAEDDDIALQSTSCRWSLVCRARQLSWLCADLGRAPQSTSSIQVLSKAQASSSNCAQCLFQQGPSKAQAQAQAQASSSKASSSKAQHRCFG